MIKNFIITLIVIVHILLLTQNYSYIIEGYRLGFGFTDLYSTLFDIKYTFNYLTFFIFFVMSLLLSINIVLAIEYYKARGTMILKYNKGKNAIATLLAIVGLGCASCGAVGLSLLMSLLGLGAGSLPLDGAEFGLVGLLIMAYSTYTLYKKYRQPYVC